MRKVIFDDLVDLRSPLLPVATVDPSLTLLPAVPALDDNRTNFSLALLGGSRSVKDNNYSHQKIRPGVCAVDGSSESPSHYIIGKARKENGNLVVDCFEIVSIEATRQTHLTPIAYPLNQVTT